MPSREIEDRFVSTYLEDANRDRVRPLAEYQSLFPGHETTIAREYRLLEEDDFGDAGGGSGGPHRAEEAPAADPRPVDHHQAIGRYRIRRELGRGGQARVYLAHDPRLDRDVALKVLETTRFGLDVESRMQRFRREAELAARLDHPGICGVLDVGADEATGVVYIAMRYIEGQTLAQLIAGAAGQDSSSKAVSLPPSEDSEVSADSSIDRSASRRSGDTRSVRRVLEVVEKIARALHTAHERGLVHRDIKPGNIMISSAGEPVVLDFGLARDEGSDALGLTLSGDVLGTPYYMSPEQVRGEHTGIDRRTDIYSLGVTLYECLTLRRPFQASSREALYEQIVGESLPDPRRLNRNIPRDLKIVLETVLEKDRERRYPNALAFADDLRRVRNLEPITARALPVWLRARRWVQRNPAVATFVGVLVVALAVTLFMWRAVEARNVELEKVQIAATYGQVADSIEAGRGRQKQTRRLLLDQMPEAQRSTFTWRWLNTRSDGPEAVSRVPSERPVRSVAFSADEHSLLAIRLDRSARDVRDAVSSGELCALSIGTRDWKPIGRAFTARLSPDRKLVVAGDIDGQTIELFDAKTFKSLGRASHDAPVSAVCWSHDGDRVAAAGTDGSVNVWRIEQTPDTAEITPAAPTSLRSFGWQIRAIDFSPDDKRLLIAGDHDHAWIVDATGGGERTRIAVYGTDDRSRMIQAPDRIRAARFSPDGKLVVLAGRLGRVALYGAENGLPVRELHPHLTHGFTRHYAMDAFFDPTGRFVLSCGWDGILQVHDARSGQRLGHFWTNGHQFAAAIDPSGSKIAVATVKGLGGSGPGDVSVWHLGDLPLPVELVGRYGDIGQVVTTADHAYSVRGNSVCKHELATGRLVFALRNWWWNPRCIALRPPAERELAIGYANGHCEIVDTDSGERIWQYRAPQEVVCPDADYWPTGFHCLRYSPDGAKLAGGIGTIMLPRDPRRGVPVLVFDAEGLKHERSLDGHRDSVCDLRWQGSRLASSGRHELILWDVASWKRVVEPYPKRWGDVGILAVDTEHHLYLRTGDDELTTIDFHSGGTIERLPVALGGLRGIEFHPNGVETILATQTGLFVWDVPPRNPLLTVPVMHPPARIHSVGNEGILAGANGSIAFYEVEPQPERFGERQIEWSAGRRVQDLLAAGLSVGETRVAIENSSELDDEVRTAARRILDVTSADSWLIMVNATRILLQPGKSRAAYERALHLTHEAERNLDPDSPPSWEIAALVGLAHYRLGDLPEAVEKLQKASMIERNPYPDTYRPHDLADYQSATWFFLAMAQHQLAVAENESGDDEAVRQSLEQAWAKGIGGERDAIAAKQAYSLLGSSMPELLGNKPAPERGRVWLATGAPDADRGGTGEDAWYPTPPDLGRHVLELRYDRPLRVAEIRIFEVNVPGAVVEVELVDDTGLRKGRRSIENPATRPGTFKVKPPAGIDFPAKVVRLTLDAARREGRNGIDTVGLVGTDGTTRWPIDASVVK